MTGGSIKTTLIATVLNDADGLRGLLRALSAQTRQPDEIIVVDGGSSDGTQRILAEAALENPVLRHVVIQGVNIAAGRNRAVRLAHHDVIVCTDAGSEPLPDWFEKLIEPFEDEHVSVVGGAYRVSAQSRLERVVGLATMPGQLAPVDPATFNPSARSMAFRVSAWRMAGGFPEWLYTAEDTLFDCKLRRCGLGFSYAADAIVEWRPRGTWAAIWRQFREYGRGEAHIGRGADSTRYWTRRYLVAACTILITLIAGAVTASRVPFLLGLIGAGLWLAMPMHRRARCVARFTGSTLDYAWAVLVLHWVAIAGIRGQVLGRKDRCDQARKYVGRLRAYWGSDRVADVPRWRLVNPPVPRTLVMSWHWPPIHRASTAVMANLFRFADSRAFAVVTRRMPAPEARDAVRCPPLRTSRIDWPQRDDEMRGIRTWLSSIWTAARMVHAGRKLHRRWPYRNVLAVYPHRWSLLAGWLTSRMTGASLVLYMHDLFAETLSPDRRVRQRFWRWVDRKALGRAELVVVPTREFAEHYRRRGIESTWVLPHCVPSGVRSPAPLTSNPTLRLLYSGSVYEAHEDALRVFVETVDTMADVDVAFHTNRNRVLRDERVRWLPRADALRAMQAADVLVVLLGQETPYPDEVAGCFPSKIADYLAAARPILAIVPPNSFVARFVEQSGCGVVVTTRKRDDIAAAIESLRSSAKREHMVQAARRVSGRLHPKRWMKLFAQRLAQGPDQSWNGAFSRSTPRATRHHQPIVRLELQGVAE